MDLEDDSGQLLLRAMQGRGQSEREQEQCWSTPPGMRSVSPFRLIACLISWKVQLLGHCAWPRLPCSTLQGPTTDPALDLTALDLGQGSEPFPHLLQLFESLPGPSRGSMVLRLSGSHKAHKTARRLVVTYLVTLHPKAQNYKLPNQL